jgi:hypothetical protein
MRRVRAAMCDALFVLMLAVLHKFVHLGTNLPAHSDHFRQAIV